jgi:hypothetical protein
VTVEQAVLAQGMSAAAVISIAATRGYTTRYPQGVTFPAVLALIVDDSIDAHLRGMNRARRAIVQLEAADREESGIDAAARADALADALVAAITPTPFVDGSPATLSVTGIPAIVRRKTYDPDDRRVVRVLLDCTVLYRRVS